MTELQLEVLFGGMGYEVQNVRIVEDVRTGASKGCVKKHFLLPWYAHSNLHVFIIEFHLRQFRVNSK